MKTLVIFALIFVTGTRAALDSDYVQKILKDMHEVGQKCQTEVGASSADLLELMQYKFPPTTHEARCILSCFYKHYKMMKDDGNFDKETTVTLFDDIKKMDEELYGKIMQVIDTCETKAEHFEDHCETASAMAGCVKEEAAKLGVTKEAFLA